SPSVEISASTSERRFSKSERESGMVNRPPSPERITYARVEGAKKRETPPLPLSCRTPVDNGSFQVQHAGAGLAIRVQLAVVDRLHAAAMLLRTQVVKVRHHAEPIAFERQPAVGIQQVGLVLIHQVLDPVEPFALPPIRSDVRAANTTPSRWLRSALRVVVIEIGVGGVVPVIRHAREGP